MTKPMLRLDWCSHEAAKYAVEHWHYSRRMPKSKLARVGVWEEDKFRGVVIFGMGGTPMMGRAEGLPPFQTCELVRVALAPHQTPTSKIVAIALRFLKRGMAGIRLVVSFADTAQGHVGTIYQASGWFYVGGKEETNGAYRVNGKIVHPRSLHHRYGTGGQSIPWLRQHVDPNAERIKTPIKHKYLYPLDDDMRAKIAPLAKPYPKRPRAESIDADAPAFQVGEDGSLPISALQPNDPMHREASHA